MIKIEDINKNGLKFIINDQIPDKTNNPNVININGEIYIKRSYINKIIDECQGLWIYQEVVRRSCNEDKR